MCELVRVLKVNQSLQKVKLGWVQPFSSSFCVRFAYTLKPYCHCQSCVEILGDSWKHLHWWLCAFLIHDHSSNKSSPLILWLTTECAYCKVWSISTHQAQVSYEYTYSNLCYQRSTHNNISTLWILVSISPTSLWVEFHCRLNVDSCPKISSSNTGPRSSMVRYYFTATGCNWGDCSDANSVVQKAACSTLGGLVKCQPLLLNSDAKDWK